MNYCQEATNCVSCLACCQQSRKPTTNHAAFADRSIHKVDRIKQNRGNVYNQRNEKRNKSKKSPEIDSQVALQHFKGGLFTRVITCIENSTTYFINLLYSLLVLLFFPLDKNILESNKASSQ